MPILLQILADPSPQLGTPRLVLDLRRLRVSVSVRTLVRSGAVFMVATILVGSRPVFVLILVVVFVLPLLPALVGVGTKRYEISSGATHCKITFKFFFFVGIRLG